MTSSFADCRTVEEAALLVDKCTCAISGGNGRVIHPGYLRADMPVGHPLFGKVIPCRCKTDATARARADELRRRSNVSLEALEAFRLGDFKPDVCIVPERQDDTAVCAAMREALNICKQFAKRPHGWLVMAGRRGCGKTHLAIGIAGHLISASRSVYYGTAISMLNMLRGTYDTGNHDEYVADLKACDVLILDDLGSERRTDWGDETLFDVLNDRHMKRAPVVVTTNAMPGEDAIEERLRSRMREGTDTPDGFVREIILPAGDYRPNVRYGMGVEE